MGNEHLPRKGAALSQCQFSGPKDDLQSDRLVNLIIIGAVSFYYLLAIQFHNYTECVLSFEFVDWSLPPHLLQRPTLAGVSVTCQRSHREAGGARARTPDLILTWSLAVGVRARRSDALPTALSRPPKFC